MKSLSVAFIGLVCLSTVSTKSLSSPGDQIFLVSGPKLAEESLLKRTPRAIKSSITSMHVTSVVMSRFSRVTFVSKMENNLDEAKEMTFSVRLPEAAFITQFDMVVAGVTFVGVVKEKEVAKQEYKQEVASGNTAGIVEADVRETQTFDVSANVPAHSSVDFHLVYQQLLQRKLGIYDHVIMVSPGQVVDDFVVDVYITERTGFTTLSALSPRLGSGERGKVSRGFEGQVAVNTVIRRSKNQAKVTFKPTATQQRLLLMIPEDERKFTVSYDVTREKLGGEIQTRNGYFVHFFAPESLPVMPKKVVFVIDRSGSMSGRKMQQTKEAFVSILKELRDVDQFNIVTFASSVTVWKSDGTASVNEENVESAIKYVQSIRAIGGTNFNDGVLKGAKLLKNVSIDERVSSMLIVLTDGQPTSGVTNSARIRLNVRTEVAGRFSIFCLGFGEDLNHDFLKRLANENDGLSRQIYEDSDANLQLERFFQEVATPLLLHVSMSYSGESISDLTRSKFDKYFSGSEVVVVGAFQGEKTVKSKIEATSLDGGEVYDISSTEVDDTFQHWFRDTGDFDDFIERLWAYFTIRELLEKKVLTDSRIEMEEINNKVLSLALKYKFVTPLTSMVVTLPKEEETTARPDPTISPTIPPCFPRGSDIPRYLVLPPIWCPYIVGSRPQPVEEKPKPSHGQGIVSLYTPIPQVRQLGRGQSRSLSIGPPSMKLLGLRAPSYMLATQRVYAATTTTRGPRPKTFATRMPYTTTTPPLTTYGYQLDPYSPISTPPKRIQTWESCSGTVSSPSHTFKIPKGKRWKVFFCEWNVNLTAGSWIDLFAETMNTTYNQVTISTRGEPILEHFGGTSPSRYIPVTHNEINIKMKIFRKDKNGQGIVISYNEFIPDAETPTSPPGKDLEDIISQREENCGENITSSSHTNGFISSPNYPELYPSNAFCLWNFVNEYPGNVQLKIRFEDMDLEMSGESKCLEDVVILRYGDEELSLCDLENSDNDFIISSDDLKIAFVSGDKFEATGFRAYYEFIENAEQ